jgi:3'-phosphoadenosine 5'-phosphosulfate sulfotransferase (PAPS reductase)/FAD synthetase
MKQFVSFSGGKDSTALALLYPDAIPVFTDTGWEFPELYAQMDQFERVTGREILRIVPDETLPEYIKRSKFMPGHGARFCTRMFKIEAFDNWIKETSVNDEIELMIGLRWDEPDRRGNFSKLENVNYTYPLRDYWRWGINDVLRICLKHDLLPRYPVYMARGGCTGCFYKRKAEIKAMVLLARPILMELMALEDDVQDERGKFAIMFPNAGKSIRHIIEEVDSQNLMFDVETIYAQINTDDRGRACGLFCNR